MHQMSPNWTSTLKKYQKYTVYTDTHDDPILVGFALQPVVSKISHIL